MNVAKGIFLIELHPTPIGRVSTFPTHRIFKGFHIRGGLAIWWVQSSWNLHLKEANLSHCKGKVNSGNVKETTIIQTQKIQTRENLTYNFPPPSQKKRSGICRFDECRLLHGKLEWYGMGLKPDIRDVCIAVGSIVKDWRWFKPSNTYSSLISEIMREEFYRHQQNCR